MLGRSCVPGAAQHEVVRCRPGTVPVCGGPGSAVQRFASARAAPRPGHARASDAFVALFTFQTAHLVPAAHLRARGLHLCFANPNRGAGGAPRNVRVQRHPLGVHITRHARRLRGALRPMTRRTAVGNNVMISILISGSVPIVSQTEIKSMKTALSPRARTTTALTEPPPQSRRVRARSDHWTVDRLWSR